MSQKLARLIALISFAITHAVVGSAQVEQGPITGSVTDQSDALIAGAQVTVRNVRTGVKSVTRTSSGGYYSAPY